MLKMIVATVLLAGAGVALASEASFDQAQVRAEKAAPASKDSGSKPVMACSCAHGHA